MELKFIGKGSAFNPDMKNTSAFFMVDDNLFLIDCGESVFGSIWNMSELRNCKDIFVFITHLHADHVGSLGSLISYVYYMLNKKLHVIHPNTTIVDYLTMIGIDKVNYIYEKNLPENIENVTIKAIEVEHVPKMRCFGYLIKTSSLSFFYSGDSKEIPGSILRDFMNGDIDEIYQDTAMDEKENPTHCYIGNLEKAIPYEKRNRVYCMHLDGEWGDFIQSKGFRIVEVVDV